MKIKFAKNQKYKTKTFRTEEKLYKFLTKHNITTFIMNGITHIYIGGN